MKYSYIIFCFLISFKAFGDDHQYFDLIKKSTYESIREKFEAELGILTTYDYILIYPEGSQISVVKIVKSDNIVRKYWRSGFPKGQVMTQKFSKTNVLEFKKSIEKIFTEYGKKGDKSLDKSLDKAHLILFSKEADGHTWRCVRFPSGIESQEFKILYNVMIPSEDIPDPKDVEDFLRE